ncbi:MAG: heterodisulfide reductase-related iron-sulfur binding cluster [Syntrophales bacterium]|jgi:Fe-S oxidoreductase/nitrate reductase gamma subunit|nr:heterodisulfide reductase-related iron-sulfur binding cluster [Syntrophales bacterium]MCK9527753.1 heterodisulfide reductase-related iron-sulfur binding cluster [Syntrophales bacterium]MDX9921592.1 heterodisulfide reductase-related iron-sulfur binding cluster [Syntrophales bacterium]
MVSSTLQNPDLYYVGHEGREVFWNAQAFEIPLFLFTAVALAIFAYGIYRRWRMWKAMGLPETRTDRTGERITSLIVNGLFQARTFKESYAGIFHALIFFGFLVLMLGAAVDASQFHFGLPFFHGPFYLWFSLLMEIFGLAVLTGVILAVIRRYIQKPDLLGYRGVPDNLPDDAVVLVLLALIITTGFIIEALRLHVNVNVDGFTWGHWSFVGYALSKTLAGVDYGTTMTLHKVTWWTHTFISLTFIAYIPYSRLLHIFTTSANYYLRDLEPTGTLKPIADFENAESFGVGRLEEFTWKQIFDSDACTRCGRCQDGCPAYLSGKPLSPKKMIQDIKEHWLERVPVVLAAKAAAGKNGDGEVEIPEPEKALVGEVIDLHELWACTNCMYCMENCPALIEHVPKIVEMRQYKVLMEADFSPELQLTYRNMENNSNPWGVGAHLRGQWAKEAGVPTLAENPEAEYLFYVGCSGSFDDQGKKVSIAFAKILQAAGVSFAILGEEEGCCGDSAMRGGNEYLYQTQAQMNIEVMNGYGVRKIICTCPHGYNALKKDYPHFGGNFEVYHHTEIIARLITEGKIALKKPFEGVTTYHDSCFLGRYNNIYEQPRKILQAIPGSKLVEMKSTRTKSFCCGAGGARMWMEEDIGERINDMRAAQAIEAKADTIAVACPFCLTMMADGIKDHAREESMKSIDIAEIVWYSMGLEGQAAPAEAETPAPEEAEADAPAETAEPEAADETKDA